MDDATARLKAVTAWLAARTDVQNWRVGKVFDVWHGNFQDIEGETHPQMHKVN